MIPFSYNYWEQRYYQGGDSGSGSHGALAQFKADTINDIVVQNHINSVVEFGCGDGNQLSLARYPRYIGLDVSFSAIGRCLTRFADDSTKCFFLYDTRCFCDRFGVFACDLALSIDVLYHIVESDLFETYLRQLFAAGRRFVLVYSSNLDAEPVTPHIHHRSVVAWVNHHLSNWELRRVIQNPFPSRSGSDFYLFARLW